MHNLKKVSPVLVAVASGLLVGVGTVLPLVIVALPLVVLGLLGMVYLLERAASGWQAALLMALAWWMKSLVSLVWFWSVYPIEWLPMVPPAVQVVAIGGYWATVGLWLGFGGLVVGVVGWRVVRSGRLMAWAVVPFLFVVGEWLGAVSFSVFTAGPGSLIGPTFGLGMVGYTVARTPLVALAAYGGVATLTLVVVATVVVGYQWQLLAHRGRLAAAGAGCVVLVLVSQASSLAGQMVSVSVVNTTFREVSLSDPEAYAARQTALGELVQTALDTGPQYLLLPEDARYAAYRGLGDSSAPLYFTLGQPKTTIVDSARVDLADGAVLQAVIMVPETARVTTFDKNYLVPQGEFVPYFYATMLRGAGLGTVVDTLEAQSNYRPGRVQVAATPGLPGVLFCFESMKPGAAKRIATVGVPFIAHPVSHAWFHAPHTLWWQQDAMLRTQAVEAGVSIVASGNEMVGKHYRPDGSVDEGEVTAVTAAGEVRRFMVRVVP